jgi:hypothetical protein
MPEPLRAASRYETSVFVNCPFDIAYTPIFEAIVFALLDCGFTPRCALELDDARQVRFEKILDLVRSCRFEMHDISLTELDRRNRLPRFNMPLELGLFLGAQRFGGGAQRRKACLLLDREPYRWLPQSHPSWHRCVNGLLCLPPRWSISCGLSADHS